jgi:hypothetical protein
MKIPTRIKEESLHSSRLLDEKEVKHFHTGFDLFAQSMLPASQHGASLKSEVERLKSNLK